ncbi:glycosyltransferase family 4 protein [Waterburya agarophytonicola K14]|uniref:Glycosyltransferase family 4 protein n=1 Tax=Waterburya agarophytonicola KI4 TaxID=2874699 RepID=A0A964BVX7_9CYAN|nr:glycosyltransferase family 4 protein [Waterburya agarophytonicola]MCC0179586.1 glycosyltransferase family 4 protein [Waterburya agarophytonicola KI4]
MKLLYYSPASYGGIADYAHEQANALVDRGIDVTFLCTPDYPTHRGEKYQIVSVLEEFKSSKINNKVAKAINFITVTLRNFSKLARFIEANHFKYVLFGSYSEYFAPFWSYKLKKLADRGTIFGAIIHDPVRDFVVGSLWWHRWSIACGYSFLKAAFVHEAIALDTVKPMPQLTTTVIPHGVFSFPTTVTSRAETRTNLDLPLDAKVMLAFGHIRDNKNLDLAIRALANFPDLYLIVAGKEQSSGQKPVSFYQNLATDLEVGDRCRWLIKFIPDTEIASIFTATDLTLLTYSSNFRSASGVLNTSTFYRKPCLASGGQGSLKSVVDKYKLGIWIESDNVDEITRGIRQWLENSPHSMWEKYFTENSWNKNVYLVFNQLEKINRDQNIKTRS